MRLRACSWKSKTSSGTESPGEADRAGLDSFLDIKIDKSFSMSPRVEEDAVPRRVYITRAVLNQYGITDGCVGCANSIIGGTGIPLSELCRRRIEKETKNDPEQRERIQETKRKRREFIEKHAKKCNVDESAEEEQNDEQMDDIGSRGLKRKAEDNQETEPMEVMDCMCESPIDVMNIVEEDDMLEEYKADDCMEETTRNWADMTEEEHAEPKTFYDNLTGKALKHEKVIEARLDEIEALQDMGVWEVVPVAECMRKTQKKPIRGRWVDVNKGDDQMEVYRSRYVAMELMHQYGGATRDGLFAAMPPLEKMRLLLSYVASRQNRKIPHKLTFIDISNAYLHADVLNDSIYVELHGEMNMPNMCGRLLRALYGTRQAARAWEEEYTETLKRGRFPEGEVQPVHVLSSPSGRESSGPRRRFHGRRQRLGAQVRGRSLPPQVQNQSEGNPRARPS